jgi:hypothetical protein
MCSGFFFLSLPFLLPANLDRSLVWQQGTSFFIYFYLFIYLFILSIILDGNNNNTNSNKQLNIILYNKAAVLESFIQIFGNGRHIFFRTFGNSER